MLRILVFIISASSPLWCPCFTIADATAAEISEEQLEFFEREIRPVLVENCYGCHNSTDTAEGGLILDYRTAFRKGGQSGPLFNEKSPQESLLIKVLRHEIEELEMPQGADKLDDQVIKKFEKWIAMGAPDPRTNAPQGANQTDAIGWEATLKERKKWWSFQPLAKPTLPIVKAADWSNAPIDQFILAKIEGRKLSPSQIASREVLIRRLSFVLRGLPPSPEEVSAFLNDDLEEAYPKLVDRFLNSPAFGEHWARHFMDLVRYAETHGSEGDPTIPNAWKYRDYLIRALNADVPYDQILIEHVAGDLLNKPRINPELNINESAIATAHWRMCFHGFAPTDALDEKVRSTDDQINVFSKAFMGLTVSCARCHNHKFDPISQADYYALYGIVGSTRPGIIDINPLATQEKFKPELTKLKVSIRQEVGNIWKSEANELAKLIAAAVTSIPQDQLDNTNHFFHPFTKLIEDKGAVPKTEFDKLQRSNGISPKPLPEKAMHWDFRNQQDFEEWYAHGNGTASAVAAPGGFTIPHESDLIGPILSSGVYSHLLSTKHRNIFSSPHFDLTTKSELWLKVRGNSQAMVRYVVHDYPRNGTVYPVKTLTDGEWKWQRYDLSYWEGERIHIEITTAADSAVLAKGVDRSWFGIQEVVLAPLKSFRPPQEVPTYAAVFDGASSQGVHTQQTLAALYASAIQSAVSDWKDGAMSDRQVPLLEEARRFNLLPKSSSASFHDLIKQYRELEAQIAIPNRVVGPLEADATDQALYIRGNHRQAGAQISRRFLEAFNSTPYSSIDSGRLHLAKSLIGDANSLTSRVVVNRLWHYVFGAGLVRTVDNFGRLGEEPSHPELLDHLALELQRNEWSLKSSIRAMLLSKTFQLAAARSDRAERDDPDNRLLSHANVRRLSGEELRDSLLTVSGRLNRSMFGPPVGNATDHPRRSVYLSVRRNSLNPFLETFDAPVPFAPKGRRDATNVPAQSLTMLNDAFVMSSAESLVSKLAQQSDVNEKIRQLFQHSLGRNATPDELIKSKAFVDHLEEVYLFENRSRKNMNEQLSRMQTQYSQIYNSVKKTLIDQKQASNSKTKGIAPPIAEWKFDGTPNDTFNRLNGQLKGEAKIVDGGLLLNGNGYFESPPLQMDLKAKTFEVIVEMHDLNQRGGGLLTLQDLSGVTFDAVVYGEMQPRNWLAGSNNFVRTQNFQGVDEDVTGKPIHLVITYGLDGKIHCYRNGTLYGKGYQSNGPVQFHANKSQVLIGLRHGNPGGNRLFRGKILTARLYDRELNAQEVAVSSGLENSMIPETVVREAMSTEQKKQLDFLQSKIDELNAQVEQLGPPPKEHQPWIDLAHSILNLKEFIYIR